MVTPAHATDPPGTDMSNGNAPAPPTARLPSNAACMWSSGWHAQEAFRDVVVDFPAAVLRDGADCLFELRKRPARADADGH